MAIYQANSNESIRTIAGGNSSIPTANLNVLGLVKSSQALGAINVNSDGTMKINGIAPDATNTELIIGGGNKIVFRPSGWGNTDGQMVLDPTGILNVGGSVRTIGAVEAGGMIFSAGMPVTNPDGILFVHDSRNVNLPTDLGEKGVRFDFKANGVDGVDDGGGFHSVMTMQNWGDTSGGNTHQLAFTDNGNILHRTAKIGAASWGGWGALVKLDPNGNLSLPGITQLLLGSSNPGEKQLWFHGSASGTYKHNSYVYGGNTNSTTAIGMYDAQYGRGIFSYNDTNNTFTINPKLYCASVNADTHFTGGHDATFASNSGGVVLRSIYGQSVWLQGSAVHCTVVGTGSYIPVFASAFNVSSQEKYKQEIESVKEDALTLIKKSDIRQYKLKTEAKDGLDITHYGLVIGEDYNTPKEVMSDNEESVDLYSMTSLAWKAIQEMAAEIEILKADKEKMQEQINVLFEQMRGVQNGNI